MKKDQMVGKWERVGNGIKKRYIIIYIDIDIDVKKMKRRGQL